MKKLACLVLLALSLSMSGCVFIADGIVIASAAYVAHDHRSLVQTHNDTVLQQKIVHQINNTPKINQPDTYIYVTVFYNQVLLTGQVPNAGIKQAAGNIAKNAQGINILYNELSIAGKSSDLTRLSDSWLSTKVKMHLLSVKDLKSSQISINVNNGVVYILGHNLDPLKFKWASDAISKVSGVQKVVVCAPQAKIS